MENVQKSDPNSDSRKLVVKIMKYCRYSTICKKKDF